jgi:uncharacterized protein YceK
MSFNRQIVTAFAASLLCGCGTISNVNSMNGPPVMGQVYTMRPRAFGGVLNDLEWPSESPWLVWPFYIMDLPISLVADVATLPTIRERQIEFDRHCESPANAPATNPDAMPESN